MPTESRFVAEMETTRPQVYFVMLRIQSWEKEIRIKLIHCLPEEMGYFLFILSFYIVLASKLRLIFHKQQILDSSKLKEFADDNFKFDENCKKFSKRLRGISPFATVFSKDLFRGYVKTRACLGKG